MPKALSLLHRHGLALVFVALLHGVLIFALLHAIPKQQGRPSAEPETQLILVPLPFIEPARPAPKRRLRGRTAGGSNATTTYFDPYTFNPQALEAGQQRLSLALASCAPENFDRQSEEIRAACSKVQIALALKQDELGIKSDVKYGPYWREEMIKRNRPILAPCMTPGGPDLLYLLKCMYQVLFTGYDSEKAPHY